MTKVTGTKGAKGTNGTNPTAGGNGGSAINTSNGMIGADSDTISAIGGDGGDGGKNTGSGAGANGGNGGSATTSVDGNIYMPAGSSLVVTAEAQGGNGGAGGLGTPAGAEGNGGNATVNFNGNIIQTSKKLSAINIQATATAGVGLVDGNATATVNGNIVQYNGTAATNVTLAATAIDTTEVPGQFGSGFGTKSATVNGNIVQGNVGNVTLMADASYANTTATINGNIITPRSTDTGTVELEALGQNISINGNIVNLGQQNLVLEWDELGPTYNTTVSGNIFNGTGSNTLTLVNTFNPGPAPQSDTATVNLAAGSFTLNGHSNIINNFSGLALVGNIQGEFIGTSGNNVLNAGGDTTTGTIIFQGNGGTDTLTGGPNALNVAYFSGADWQYTVNMTNGNGTVVGGPIGNTSNDTLAGIQRLKFLSPAAVSDVNDDGYGDLVFGNNNGTIQVNVNDGNTPFLSTPVTISTPSGYNVVGTGQFTPDSSRDASILLQNSTTGELGIETNIVGGGTFNPVSGGPANVTSSTFTGWTAITAGDFNGDGASDVLLQNQTTGAVEIAFMNTVYGQAPGTVDQISAVTTPSGTNWSAVSSGDFNGDGNSDILWQNSVSGQLDISLMNGAVGTPVSVGTDPSGFTAVGTGDFNGDGKSDILLFNATTDTAQIWLMNGTSEIGSPINVAGPGAGWTLLGAEDVNKDGYSDLLWQNTTTGAVDATEMTAGATVLGTVQLASSAPAGYHLFASTGGG